MPQERTFSQVVIGVCAMAVVAAATSALVHHAWIWGITLLIISFVLLAISWHEAQETGAAKFNGARGIASGQYWIAGVSPWTDAGLYRSHASAQAGAGDVASNLRISDPASSESDSRWRSVECRERRLPGRAPVHLFTRWFLWPDYDRSVIHYTCMEGVMKKVSYLVDCSLWRLLAVGVSCFSVVSRALKRSEASSPPVFLAGLCACLFADCIDSHGSRSWDVQCYALQCHRGRYAPRCCDARLCLRGSDGVGNQAPV